MAETAGILVAIAAPISFDRTLNLVGTGTGNAVNFPLVDSAGSATVAPGKLNLVKDGAGDWSLGGVNTYTGTTTVRAGSLTVSSTGAIATGGLVNVLGGAFNVVAGGTVASPIVLAGTATSANAGAVADVTVPAGTRFDNTGTQVGTVTVSGGAVTSSGALGTVNVTAGTVTTTGGTVVAANLGAGTTLTSTGTLGGTVNVGAGATYNGTGTVGTVNVATGGTVAPQGALSAANFAFGAGANLVIEAADPANPSQRDSLSFRYGATFDGAVNVRVFSLDGTGARGAPAVFNPRLGYSWTILKDATVAANASGLNLANFVVDATGWVGAQGSWTVALDTTANPTTGNADLKLVYQPTSPLATINKIGPLCVVSDFGNNNGIIVGPEIPNWRERAMTELTCETFIDGVSVGTGMAANVPGGPLESVRFVAEVCVGANALRAVKVAEERPRLRSLPAARYPEADETRVRVSSFSTVRVRSCAYSVPARLIGAMVQVQISEAEVVVRHEGCEVVRYPRTIGHQARIDYRHVITSLARKPGAFAGYIYREELFPRPAFRQAYDELVRADEPKIGRAHV